MICQEVRRYDTVSFIVDEELSTISMLLNDFAFYEDCDVICIFLYLNMMTTHLVLLSQVPMLLSSTQRLSSVPMLLSSVLQLKKKKFS